MIAVEINWPKTLGPIPLSPHAGVQVITEPSSLCCRSQSLPGQWLLLSLQPTQFRDLLLLSLPGFG